MILKRQNMSENKWNHFKIVPQGHNHCQLSIVNCQFGEAVIFQFAAQLRETNLFLCIIPSFFPLCKAAASFPVSFTNPKQFRYCAFFCRWI